jgi:hypothetical protein
MKTRENKMDHNEYRARFERKLIASLPLLDVMARSVGGNSGKDERLVVKAAGALYRKNYDRPFDDSQLEPALAKSLVDMMSAEGLMADGAVPEDANGYVENVFGDDELDSALARLTPVERLVNILATNSGLSIDQIAYVLSIDPAEMTEVLRGARRRMHRELIESVRASSSRTNDESLVQTAYPVPGDDMEGPAR